MESLGRDDSRTELVQSFALQVSDMCLRWGGCAAYSLFLCCRSRRDEGLPLWGVLGVILCCVSLPRSQGDSSKNSVVSSSSTKDSSMSSAAPMVHHPRLVLITLSHHFHLLLHQSCLLLLCDLLSSEYSLGLASLTTFTFSSFASDLTNCVTGFLGLMADVHP